MNVPILRRQIRVLLRHPSLLTRVYRGEINVAREHVRIELGMAKSLFESSRAHGNGLMETIRDFKSKECYSNAYLYAVCKLLSPMTIIETGVNRGTSTAFILQAISENGKGHLYSIDLPNVIVEGDTSNIIPPAGSTGFLIPQGLREPNWTLILGDSKDQLPRLLERLESVDVFHHDSLHTYDHMMFEYHTVWPKLSKGGVLLSDDARSNAAFADFCAQVGATAQFVGDSGFASKVS